MDIGYLISYVREILFKPNFIGAVSVVIFIQYRSTFLNFLYTAIDDGIIQTFFNLILNIADVVRGYYHVSREIIRDLGQNFAFLFLNGNDDENWVRYPSLQRETNNLENNDSISAPTHNNNRKRRSSCGSPPPLVDLTRNCDTRKGDGRVMSNIGVSLSAVTSGSISNKMEPLEPAFLNKEDYPPGWLVYHPDLGVSSVKEADEYDEQQLLTKNREQE